jgi:hypothetical protein
VYVFIVQDNVITTMYTGIGPEQKMAQEVLTTLKEHPDSWTKVITLFYYCRNVSVAEPVEPQHFAGAGA